MGIHEPGIGHKEFLVWELIVVMVFYVVYYDTSLQNMTDSFITKCDHFITKCKLVQYATFITKYVSTRNDLFQCTNGIRKH